MSQGSRPDRVADQIRSELAELLARDVHDPGLGFVTLTRVQVSADIQQARVFYTVLGDEKAHRSSGRALSRAAGFLRRQIGRRLRLKRVPELTFLFDESISGQARIEELLQDIHHNALGSPDTDDSPPSDRQPLEPAARIEAQHAGDRGIGSTIDKK